MVLSTNMSPIMAASWLARDTNVQRVWLYLYPRDEAISSDSSCRSHTPETRRSWCRSGQSSTLISPSSQGASGVAKLPRTSGRLPDQKHRKPALPR